MRSDIVGCDQTTLIKTFEFTQVLAESDEITSISKKDKAGMGNGKFNAGN